MNDSLFQLITDFQASVESAVKLMQRSGIRMPSSRAAWINADIPHSGDLDGGGKYYKHGVGCWVCLNTGNVDFDFGEQGEIGGFNLWWLTQFAGERLVDYGFSCEDELEACLDTALASGALIYPDSDLYYIAGVPRIYAIDIDCRLPDDMLPGRNQDRVFVLQSHYFQTAELMFENYEKLSRKWDKTHYLSQREAVDRRIYLSTWLGFLGVTCEGFKKLKMRLLLEKERPESFNELIPLSDNIGRLMKRNADSLREFRNNVFHLRENPEVVRQFFDRNSERLPWARELHAALVNFFSAYRVMCEVHYVMHGRKSESDLRRKRVNRKRSTS
ncbi:DUF6896 domain-containing protein [Pectobacterium sp. B1J-3]|uniref:DUF6896 domain-containing protein n=1 Tax=Pectobacterium sp. B1J-3 TaxID=3385371 RepID=UPI003906AFEC